jgi:hypothetical protein
MDFPIIATTKGIISLPTEIHLFDIVLLYFNLQISHPYRAIAYMVDIDAVSQIPDQ